MSKKVVTFGEIMLRLATPGYQRFSQATEFTATFGGGEANVLVSLANYGIGIRNPPAPKRYSQKLRDGSP